MDSCHKFCGNPPMHVIRVIWMQRSRSTPLDSSSKVHLRFVCAIYTLENNIFWSAFFFIPVIGERPDFRVCQEFRCLCLFPYLKMEQISNKVSSTHLNISFFLFIWMYVSLMNFRGIVLNLMISKDNFLTWKGIKFLFRTDKRRTSMNGN